MEAHRNNASPTDRKPVSAEARALQARAHDLIPGGAHTYAKGDDQYPRIAPPFLERGRGCHVWDLDGNEYVEYGMGLRAVTLGHAYPRVVDAAERELRRGSNFIRPSPLELETAEALLSLLGIDGMVKFARNGSDVTTAAVKLARAATDRDLVAICADQPFFSTDDWFIGATPMAAGIPQAVRELTLGFPYGDLDGLRALLDSHPEDIACLVMEAETTLPPPPGYLQGVESLCRERGVVFILDEMITGFRWSNGGAQAVHGITPDLAAFGKGMSNGVGGAALVGKRELMELGGLHHEKERVFLLSTTNGAEHGALGATLETIKTYGEEPVVETLRRQGERLRNGVEQAAADRGISSQFVVLGHPSNLVFGTRDAEGRPSQEFRALFMQEIIRRGVIGPSFVVSYSHADEDIDFTVDVVADALEVYRDALDGGVDRFLEGPPTKRVFRERN